MTAAGWPTARTSNGVVHFDASYGFDTRTACKKSTHVYADAMRRSPIRTTRDTNKVSCKSCRKALDKQR